MHPSTISTKETQFADSLNAAGTKYTLVGTTDIPGGFTIRSIRPSALTYFYQTETEKKTICLHFTVGYIMSDIPALTKSTSHVSVSYVVDRAGRIYELFPDKYWSYHLGSGTIGGNATMSKKSIGIEISNYGPLELKSGKLIDCYGNTYCSESETDLYDSHEYRGKKYYATMTGEQIAAVKALVEYLCDKHAIPLNFITDDNPFKSEQDALGFTGIFFHSNVRKDKFDWPLSKSMSALVKLCTEQPEDVAEPETEPVPEPVAETTPEPEQPKPAPIEEPAMAEPRGSSKSGLLGKIIEFLTKLLRKN